MKIVPTAIAGVFRIELKRSADERGWFARTYDREQLAEAGLCADFIQDGMAFNHRQGTIRGMHYQIAPYAETKIVSCVRGAIFDVVVDLRPQSATYGSWIAERLDDRDRSALYIPEGCAHGYQTLEDACEVAYRISARYSPQHAYGVRWDDPDLAIAWPLEVTIVSARDKLHPFLAAVTR